ncbi:hypothetical protein GALMADRAFT_238754 [Galerina marginata CBS 339.88]|uniref:Uncharacterized protein n=1 Tax=Galerina marginata (strain CBS 339.88) TaxID=685588 RepID=A0A067TL11_GALM3|nr:hypothetical protein GALMADRAFT_238754 [Galerina marginata CBS 339.88]
MSKPWSRPPFPFYNILLPEEGNSLLDMASEFTRTTNPMHQIPQTAAPSSLPPPSAQPDDPMDDEERDPGYQGDVESPRKFVDPRKGKTATPTARKLKSYQQKLLHSVVRNYLVSKNLLPQKEDDGGKANETPGPMPSLPPSPDPAIVGAYLAFQHNGPSIENILIHWRCPMTHLWNAKAIQLLVAGFEVYMQDKQLVKLVELLGAEVTSSDIGKRLDEICDVQELIEQKLTSHRSTLRSLLRQVEVMTATMNATEISAVLQKKNHAAQCRSRRKERKKLKFLRRDDIIEQAMLLPKNYENADNAKRWKDIKLFFSHFSVPEMSTDESETEGTFSKAKTLRRVRKYWLNPAASNVLHYVDSQYSPRKISGALKRGAAPLVRIRLATKVNRTDTPTPEMPENFYGPDVSRVALEVLAPGPPVYIPVVPIQQERSDSPE